MVKRVEWIPDAIPSMDCLTAPSADASEDDVSTAVDRVAEYHAQKLRTIFPDLCLDFASDARRMDETMAKPKWVYSLQGATARTMRLKLAALASVVLLCLICAGCPDESQQQQLSHSAHPHSVTLAEHSSASSELGCAGAAILAAFLLKRKEAGRRPKGAPPFSDS
jgi:hypothetical protein